MNVRIINTDEIKLLFQLFDYNDPDEMIAENTRDINKEKVIYSDCFKMVT